MINKNSNILNVILKIIEYLTLLIIGGSIYVGIEMLWRGHSHISMFFVGGLALICVGLLNEVLPHDTPFWKQIIYGDLIVLTIEFVSGIFLNIGLGLNVWDYSDMPFNIAGQICLPFALLWMPLVAIAIILDDYIKFLFFGGRKPSYRWI